MDKIETPEEFAQQVEKAIVHQYQQSPNGRGGLIMISKDYIPAGKLIAARDALIRSDERRKAAERVDKAICEHYEEWSIGATRAGVKAAIMAEPEEKV